MILWEEESLNDRGKICEFLYDFNPDTAEKTDNLIEAKVENLPRSATYGSATRRHSWTITNNS